MPHNRVTVASSRRICIIPSMDAQGSLPVFLLFSVFSRLQAALPGGEPRGSVRL